MDQEIRLETSRLILREVKRTDRDDIVKGINNLEVSKWLSGVKYPYTKKDADEFLDKVIDKEIEKDKRENYLFCLIQKQDNIFLGCIGLHRINYEQNSCTIGYWLSQEHWRQGYMSEALREIIHFSFEDLELRRLEIEAFTDNIASNSLIKKVGFQYEGTHRKSIVSTATGIIHDAHFYGYLKEDF